MEKLFIFKVRKMPKTVNLQPAVKRLTNKLEQAEDRIDELTAELAAMKKETRRKVSKARASVTVKYKPQVDALEARVAALEAEVRRRQSLMASLEEKDVRLKARNPALWQILEYGTQEGGVADTPERKAAFGRQMIASNGGSFLANTRK
jgi:seryl-tRNA synthetase